MGGFLIKAIREYNYGPPAIGAEGGVVDAVMSAS